MKEVLKNPFTTVAGHRNSCTIENTGKEKVSVSYWFERAIVRESRKDERKNKK